MYSNSLMNFQKLFFFTNKTNFVHVRRGCRNTVIIYNPCLILFAIKKTRTKQFITEGREYHWNVVFHLTHCLAATLRYTNDQANDLPLLKIYVIPELHTVPCNSIPFKVSSMRVLSPSPHIVVVIVPSGVLFNLT